MNTSSDALEEISNQIIAERIFGILRNYIIFDQFNTEIRILPGEFQQIFDKRPYLQSYITKHINDLAECSLYTYDFYVRQETDTKNSYIGLLRRKREPEVQKNNDSSSGAAIDLSEFDPIVKDTYSSF
jgi:hypothetical protein